ncbi:hypothetical protein NBRC116588_12350 [Pyruvatibacter sp. HU-CL02332]
MGLATTSAIQMNDSTTGWITSFWYAAAILTRAGIENRGTGLPTTLTNLNAALAVVDPGKCSFVKSATSDAITTNIAKKTPVQRAKSMLALALATSLKSIIASASMVAIALTSASLGGKNHGAEISVRNQAEAADSNQTDLRSPSGLQEPDTAT